MRNGWRGQAGSNAARMRSGEHGARVGFQAVVPNPKLKLLDQVREVLRLQVVKS
jgi:hypothetical protein